MKYFFSYARNLTALLLGIAITSCSLIDQSDKIIGPEWNPDFAIPIFNTEFSMTDVLTKLDSNSYIQSDSEGLLSLVYDDQFITVNGGAIIDLPDAVVPMFDTTQRVGFPMEGIKALSIKQGTLGYSFESEETGAYQLTVQLPEATQNGLPYERTVKFNAPGTFSGSFDLSGYDLDLGDGQMTMKYFAIETGTTEKKSLLDFYFEIADLEYSQINGYLGTHTLELGKDSINLDLFSKLGPGNIRINDPSISLRLDNSYGVPISIYANNFEVTSSSGKQELEHEELENGFEIAYPESVGSSALSNLSINKDNSNLPDLLSSLPTGIKYDFSATLHPDGDTSQIGFIRDDSGFDLGLTIEIPLDLQISQIAFEQDLGLEINNVEQVESAELTLLTENGFPLELDIQAYFLDAQGIVQDSLFDGPSQVLAAAAVDQNGQVSEASSFSLNIDLSAEKWYYLQNSSEIRLKAEVSSTDAGTIPVKFYEDYSLSVKMGARVKLTP